ncbi:hypothetical protein BVRB_4g077640 [Beta vulgaris subsp. vulgaris]|nr:hypothetical protein BVRB_4g077640 [Beta vulgaris subsp. vulgaris]
MYNDNPSAESNPIPEADVKCTSSTKGLPGQVYKPCKEKASLASTLKRKGGDQHENEKKI